MAAVFAVLGPCVKMLIKEAQGEVSMLLGVSNDMAKLKRRMESLNPFIPDAEIRRVTDQRVQRWYSYLTNTMYDITNIIEICKLEADERKESRIASLEEKVHSCFHPLLFFLYNPMFAHQIGRSIKKLNQRLDNISKEAVAFNFNTDINLSSYQDMRMLREAENSSRRSMSEFDESAIVGKNVESDTKLLVQELITYDNHNIKVVSIEGMGGIGKTTLAQKIFNEKTIQENFKTRVWVGCRHFDDTELLRSAIKHAGRDHGNERDMSLLIRTLTDALSARKFLIVMDDMCSIEVWHNLLSVPVRNASHKQQGSRVIVTTRFEDMALKMGTAFHRHRVSPLDAKDAWSLLKIQLTPNQVRIDHLKNIGMEILKRCDGLPLAIKVMGGHLSTKYPSEGDWKTVLNSPAWSVDGLPPEVDSRLYLSYGELSPQLKQCFLYCSLIPKGSEILQDEVARMWISEGFIHSLDGNSSTSSNEHTLEDIAIEYYHELRKRNLIETGRRFTHSGLRSTLHDVVRSFAEYVSREELMVVADREHAVTAGNGGEMLVLRLSIGQVVSVAEWAALKRREALRTLIINAKVNFEPGYSLDNFSSLRVLYICSADCNGFVASLSGLKHLRYLHLEETDISKLPDDIHKMKFLLYITVIKCKKLDHLPSSITELVHLRSLDIRGSNVSAMPNGFGRLTNLKSLYGFQAHMDIDAGSSCLSKQLVPLSELRDLTIENLGKVTASWMVEKDTISTKGHLGYLVLNYSNSTTGHTVGMHGDDAEQQQQQSVAEDVLEKLRPPNSINNLTVKGGYVGRQLPNWMQAPESARFTSLRFLMLENLHCCTQLPDGLGCLLSLELLTIMQAPAIKRIGNEFQAPPSLAEGDSTGTLASFPKLKKLQLIGLCEWEEWEWKDPEEQEGAIKDTMPCLEWLHINNCKLSYLPPGLANSNRQALRRLALCQVYNLTSLENFPSVSSLDVFDCPELKCISGFTRLHKIRIVRCPNFQVLEGVPALNSMVIEDVTLETVPEYLITVNPKYLHLYCSKTLKESLSSPGSSEYMKISHIQIFKVT